MKHRGNGDTAPLTFNLPTFNLLKPTGYVMHQQV